MPVSVVLATRSEQYVDGLTDDRYLEDPDSDAAQARGRAWLAMLIEATMLAGGQAAELTTTLTELRAERHQRLARRRLELGKRSSPRADSASARLLDQLPQLPVLTARTLQRILDVSFPAANAALDELADAEVLSPRTIERNTTAYLAEEVLDPADDHRASTGQHPFRPRAVATEPRSTSRTCAGAVVATA